MSTEEAAPSEVDGRALIRYRMPVTTVRISGIRTHVINRASVPEVDAISRTATAVTQIDADPRQWFSFHDPGPRKRRLRPNQERQLEFGTRADGRMQSLNATITDTSAERLKASIQLGSGVAGAVSTLLLPAGPLGVAVGVAAGVVTGAVSYRFRSIANWDGVFEGEIIEVAPRPSLQSLGIPPSYMSACRESAELFGNLKWSEVQLLDAISRSTTSDSLASAGDLATRLRSLQRSLGAVRDALMEAERECLTWVAAQADTVETAFDVTLFADQLPTTEELHAAVADRFAANASRPWVAAYRDLRFAVTCDLLDHDVDQNRTVRPGVTDRSAEVVWHRRARLATITCWQIREKGSDLSTHRTLVERKVVVLPGDEEPVRVVARTGAGTATLTFDGDGLLTGLGAHDKDTSLDTLKAVAQAPSLIKDGLAAGSSLVDALTTSDAEKTARAKNALDLIKAERELAAAQGPAAPDRLKQIRDQVEEAELQARLAQARLVASDPTSSVIHFVSLGSPPAAPADPRPAVEPADPADPPAAAD